MDHDVRALVALGLGALMGLGTGLREAAVRWFVRGVVSDIAKGKYGEGPMAFWKFLDGRKTALGLLITDLPLFSDKLIELLKVGGAPEHTLATIGVVIGHTVLILGVLHKLVKGDSPAAAIK